MAISDHEVRHLAKLANLALTDDEVARYARELEAIVGYVEQLSQVDTTGVAPIANIAGLGGVERPDEPAPMLTTAAAMAIAPARTDSAYLVPKVVER
jgi:aspartyl-tRNA(Asn)/glutamyl-tRNA(Gln) amidotransferase subunit C